MPTLSDFQFCGPTFQAVSPVIDAQDCLNLYPEFELATSKSRIALVGTPGLTLFGTLPQTPVRGLWAGNGNLYAVGGTHFYQLASNGTVSQDFGAMPGSTGGANLCQIFSNSNQLLVQDPSSNAIYFADPAGPGPMTKVLDGRSLEYLDGFFLAIATGASLATVYPNQVSQSANLDGTSWPALTYGLRTGTPDALTRLAAINGKLWLFGQNRTEIWFNAGTAGFAFAREATINQGLLAPESVAKIDNTVFWLGASEIGTAVVYRANGQTPVRISTSAIEGYLNTLGSFGLSGAQAYSYQEAGHTFYVLYPGAGDFSLVYDITTEMWHRRAQWTGTVFLRPKACCFAASPLLGTGTPPKLYVGDFSSGNIYRQDITLPSDNGAAIRRIRTAPHLSAQNRWAKYGQFVLDADIVLPNGNQGTLAPVLDYSNDGGITFGNGTPSFTLTKTPFNSQGGNGRYVARRLGRSKDRVFRVTATSSTDLVRYVNAYIEGDPGTET